VVEHDVPLRMFEVLIQAHPGPAVCTENSIRVDYVTESPNVSGEDAPIPRAVQTLAVPILGGLHHQYVRA
jgi:hypothetical protein